MSYEYLEIGEAIAIHDALIQEFGGAMGIRDEARWLRHSCGRSWAITTA